MTIQVRCIFNTLHALVDEKVRRRLADAIHYDGPLPGLDIGEVYDVVAVEARMGGIWLLIHTIQSSEFPYPYPLEMFEVLDTSVPRGWSLFFETGPGGTILKRISFHEWAQDSTFYERLVDGDEDALAVYERERRLLRSADVSH